MRKIQINRSSNFGNISQKIGHLLAKILQNQLWSIVAISDQKLSIFWQNSCTFWKILEIGTVHKCATLVDVNKCTMSVFACKNRLQYSRERALQGYILIYFLILQILTYKNQVPYFEAFCTICLNVRTSERTLIHHAMHSGDGALAVATQQYLVRGCECLRFSRAPLQSRLVHTGQRSSLNSS